MKNGCVFLIAIFALCSCRSAKNVERIVVERHDTLVKVVDKEVLVRDTLWCEIPQQEASSVTRDTSFLENDFATSEAWTDTCGMLHHELRTKPHRIDIPFERKDRVRDSICYVHDKVPVPYEVEKKLTRWEKTSIKYFSASLWAAAILTILLFRKPIFKVIRKVFGR